MSRIVFLAAIAGIFLTGIFLTGCSHSDTPVTTTATPITETKKGGLAPTVTAAPPGTQTGDHRGGMEGGTIPGVQKR